MRPETYLFAAKTANYIWQNHHQLICKIGEKSKDEIRSRCA